MLRTKRDIEAPGVSEEQLKQLIKDHRENEKECRWCFAIDLQRVEANQVAQYNFPDATILALKCDRCGGEFSYYIRAWGEDYIKERIATLHPELENQVSANLIGKINDRLWPESNGNS